MRLYMLQSCSSVHSWPRLIFKALETHAEMLRGTSMRVAFWGNMQPFLFPEASSLCVKAHHLGLTEAILLNGVGVLKPCVALC